VSGRVSSFGGHFRLTIRALDVQTARVQGQYNQNIGTERDITALMRMSGGTVAQAPVPPTVAVPAPTQVPHNQQHPTNRVATSTPITELFSEGGGNRYAVGHGAIHFGNPILNVSIVSSVSMGNSVHNNAIVFDSRSGGTTRQFSVHNLNRGYRFLTGYVGRVDNSAIVDARVRFYGDGRLLAEYELRGRDLPRSISLLIEGINILRVEMAFESPPGTNQYAFVGFVE